MRNILIFTSTLFILILFSCAPQKSLMTFEICDYKKYNDAGFFISPDAYNGKYKPLGQIYLTIKPSSIEDPDNKMHLILEEFSNEQILALLTNKAKEMGANGLVDFKITRNYYWISKTIKSYNVSGFAVKIEN